MPETYLWDWDWVHGWSRKPTDAELVASIERRMADIQQRLDANEKKLLEILIHGKQVDGQDPPEGER